jgi:transcriptional regulator with XRE-family HTH domain
MENANARQSLGSVIRAFRARNGWTLKEMSERVDIPLSTLSKVEHDRLTLSYDKLQQLSERLGVRMAELFSEVSPKGGPVTARRSVGTIESAVHVASPNYDYFYLCTELRRKRMIPAIIKVRAASGPASGELVRHSGEEFIFVVQGAVDVLTEYYDPVRLEEGQCMYLDSSMGHAYVAADGHPEAVLLGMVASDDEDIMGLLMSASRQSPSLPGRASARNRRKGTG